VGGAVGAFDLVVFDCDGVLVDTSRPRTAFVEDSPAGITAGVAAGMTVFAYTGGGITDAAAVQALGAIPFATMTALPALLAR
jgi:beta-phosphoglucomutase-like phosphatase (HAD superfamily)